MRFRALAAIATTACLAGCATDFATAPKSGSSPPSEASVDYRSFLANNATAMERYLDRQQLLISAGVNNDFEGTRQAQVARMLASLSNPALTGGFGIRDGEVDAAGIISSAFTDLSLYSSSVAAF